MIVIPAKNRAFNMKCDDGDSMKLETLQKLVGGPDRAGARLAERRVGAGEGRGRHSAAGERGRADEGAPPDEPARQ